MPFRPVEGRPLAAAVGAGAAVAGTGVFLADNLGVRVKRQTVSPYRLPAGVALKSARTSPDLASSMALDLQGCKLL